MMQMTFKKDYLQWKKGASYELGGGVSGILIDRGIAYQAKPDAESPLKENPEGSPGFSNAEHPRNRRSRKKAAT